MPSPLEPIHFIPIVFVSAMLVGFAIFMVYQCQRIWGPSQNSVLRHIGPRQRPVRSPASAPTATTGKNAVVVDNMAGAPTIELLPKLQALDQRTQNNIIAEYFSYRDQNRHVEAGHFDYGDYTVMFKTDTDKNRKLVWLGVEENS